MHARSVLVVDDDETFRMRLVDAFRRRGFDVRGAESFATALELARGESPEFAVVDLKMPGGSGLSLVRELLALDATTRVVVLTAYGSIATTVEAMRAGAVNYLSKPATLEQILGAFEPTTDASAAHAPHALPSLARMEWEYIQRTLTECEGNVTQAAKMLGLHRRSLQRKLEKYPVLR